MTTVRNELKHLVEALERQGDEIKLKLHLAKSDARDEWEKMEKKWGQLKGKMSGVLGTAEDVSEDIAQAAKQLASEIEKGYERIRSRL